jgi:2-oxoglutarate dehydrogenase E2 component (dihydrolipoamide succinyltransferase)
MASMHEISVPRFNANDATYVLVEWYFDDGDEVAPGSVVASVETSKASEDLVSDDGGVLKRLADAGAECAAGSVIGQLFNSEQERSQHVASGSGPGNGQVHDGGNGADGADQLVVTAPARQLAAELGIGDEALRALGKAVIKREDVAALARGETSAGSVRPISRQQLAVADVVSRAHSTIPAAFAVLKVPAGTMLTRSRMAAGPAQMAPGIAEMLIKAVAGLHRDYPSFFSALTPDGTSLRMPEAAHVGVTIDVGSGLYIPVIRNAEGKSLSELSALLRGFHEKALTRAFSEGELTGGNIAISLSNYTDIVISHPVIFPGNACMLSLGAVQRELWMDSSGAVASRPYLLLGLAYDHRIVNGRDAVLFLRAVKTRLQAAHDDAVPAAG